MIDRNCRDLKRAAGKENVKVLDVPVWEKFALTVNEAAVYFNIGEKKIRKLVDDNRSDGFVIQNGVKVLINRRKFEEFLNDTTSI